MKKLKINTPILSTYPEYGTIFSIIPDTQTTTNWMFSNFIQLFVLESPFEEISIISYKEHRTILNSVPTLQVFKLFEQIIQQKYNNSFIEAIIDFIEQDYYIILYLDRFFLKKHDSYNKIHLTHMNLIYGYDLEKKIFYALDNSSTGKYSTLEYTFDEVSQAYSLNVDDGYRDTKTIFLVKPFDHKPLNFDIDFVVKELKFYLESFDYKNNYLKNYNPVSSINYGYNNENSNYYNFGVYEYLKKYIKEQPDSIMIQPFHIIFEHKKLMLLRIKFLYEKEFISANDYELLFKEFEDLQDKCKSLLNFALKYVLSKNKSTLNIIENSIEKIKNMERLAIENLILKIKV